jgi:hypothetical protein
MIQRPREGASAIAMDQPTLSEYVSTAPSMAAYASALRSHLSTVARFLPAQPLNNTNIEVIHSNWNAGDVTPLYAEC